MKFFRQVIFCGPVSFIKSFSYLNGFNELACIFYFCTFDIEFDMAVHMYLLEVICYQNISPTFVAEMSIFPKTYKSGINSPILLIYIVIQAQGVLP